MKDENSYFNLSYNEKQIRKLNKAKQKNVKYWEVKKLHRLKKITRSCSKIGKKSLYSIYAIFIISLRYYITNEY